MEETYDVVIKIGGKPVYTHAGGYALPAEFQAGINIYNALSGNSGAPELEFDVVAGAPAVAAANVQEPA